jgi:hypothetical protein
LIEKELALPYFSFFLLLLRHHGQVLIKGKLELPLFFLLLVFFSSRRKLAPLPSLGKGGAKAPFFFFFFLFVLSFLGAGVCHHQVLAQFGSPFFWVAFECN